jgi:hypothetical protein
VGERRQLVPVAASAASCLSRLTFDRLVGPSYGTIGGGAAPSVTTPPAILFKIRPFAWTERNFTNNLAFANRMASLAAVNCSRFASSTRRDARSSAASISASMFVPDSDTTSVFARPASSCSKRSLSAFRPAEITGEGALPSRQSWREVRRR